MEDMFKELMLHGFAHALLVVGEDDEILHGCGYPEEPSVIDISHLIDELANDEEFEITDLVYDFDYHLVHVDLMTDEYTKIEGITPI